ncbi:MAG: hypothetical protein AAFU74_18215, partial [Bacteroidota bacterium]
PKKEVYRKRLMYSLFFVLLLMSIKDTSEETIENKKAQVKMDSLISAEKKRAGTVISNLRTNLDNLESTGGLVIEMNDNLKIVKDSLAGQIITLRDVVKQSEDYVNLKKDEFRADRPDITFFTGTNDIVIDSTETMRTVSVVFGNTGGRRAINLKYKMRWYLFNNRNETVYSNNKRFRDFGLYSMSDLPPLKLSERRQLRLPLGVEKSLLQNSELELLVAFKVYFEDDFGWKSETSYFMAASEFDGEKAVFGEFQDGVRMEVIQKQMILDNDFKEFFDE